MEWNRNNHLNPNVSNDDLLFSRADDSFVDKKNYLEVLAEPNNSHDHLKHVVGEVKINDAENKAIVTVTVRS